MLSSKIQKIFAKTTHSDPRCLASCVAITTSIALVLQGKYDVNSETGIKALIDEAYQYA